MKYYYYYDDDDDYHSHTSTPNTHTHNTPSEKRLDDIVNAPADKVPQHNGLDDLFLISNFSELNMALASKRRPWGKNKHFMIGYWLAHLVRAHQEHIMSRP